MERGGATEGAVKGFGLPFEDRARRWDAPTHGDRGHWRLGDFGLTDEGAGKTVGVTALTCGTGRSAAEKGSVRARQRRLRR
jgi:hypothetical protein